MMNAMKTHRLLRERVMSHRLVKAPPTYKMGPATRGACLEKMLAREKDPSRKVEEAKSWVVFEEQGSQPCSRVKVSRAERVEGKTASQARAFMPCCEGNGKVWRLEPKSRL